VAREHLAPALSEEGPASTSALAWTARDLGQPVVDLADYEAVQAILDGRS
jgi:hypothetical protein